MELPTFNEFTSFEEGVKFILDNVIIQNGEDGNAVLKGPVYDSNHPIKDLFNPIESLSEDDIEKISDYIRLNFYVFPFNPKEEGIVGIDFNQIEPFNTTKTSLWQNDYWMAKTGIDKQIGTNIALFQKGSQNVAVSSGGWLFVGEWKVNPNDNSEFLGNIFYPKVGRDENDKGKGFVFANSRSMCQNDKGQIIRFYLNFNYDLKKINQFINDVYNCLDARNVYYVIKILENKADYNRSDTLILYAEQSSFWTVKFFLESIYEKYKSALRKPVPIFTKKIADGLGFAEEPDTLTPQSVGMHRSRLLADVIIRLAKENPNDRLTTGIELIKQTYPDLERFHLNPNSNYPYNLAISKKTKGKLIYNDKNRNFFLEGAIRIGHILCKEAVWLNENHCNWLTFSRKTEDSMPIYTFLEEKSYTNGLAGIKLFLSELNTQANDAVFEKVLEGLKHIQLKEQPYISQYKKKQYKLKKEAFHFFATQKSIKIQPLDIIDKETFENLKNGSLVNRWISRKDVNLAISMIKTHFLDKERPLKNGFDSDFFCPTLLNGYAGIGYFFLRVYSPQTILPLKLK